MLSTELWGFTRRLVQRAWGILSLGFDFHSRGIELLNLSDFKWIPARSRMSTTLEAKNEGN